MYVGEKNCKYTLIIVYIPSPLSEDSYCRGEYARTRFVYSFLSFTLFHFIDQTFPTLSGVWALSFDRVSVMQPTAAAAVRYGTVPVKLIQLPRPQSLEDVTHMMSREPHLREENRAEDRKQENHISPDQTGRQATRTQTAAVGREKLRSSGRSWGLVRYPPTGAARYETVIFTNTEGRASNPSGILCWHRIPRHAVPAQPLQPTK